ncbi:MAG: hypothetical protein ACFFBD_26265 [Candidatus Hodarchaeota archaeon]
MACIWGATIVTLFLSAAFTLEELLCLALGYAVILPILYFSSIVLLPLEKLLGYFNLLDLSGLEETES